jgi:hypothetical protein
MISVPNSTEKCIIVCWLTATLVPSDLLHCHYTYVTLFQFTCYSSQRPCPIETPNISCSMSHIHFTFSVSFQRIRQNPRSCTTFRNKLFFFFNGRICQPLTELQNCWTNTWLSASAYPIYLQLSSTSEGRLLYPQPEGAPFHGDGGPCNMELGKDQISRLTVW